MIKDTIENSDFYKSLGQKFESAFDFIKNNDLESFENGKYEITKDKVFAIIQEYETKSEESSQWEAHKKYIDIQYIISGREKLGYLNISDFSPKTEYNPEKDLVFGEGTGEFLTATQGNFIIFAPHDAHMPGIMVNKPEHVKKAVIKIMV